MSRRRRQSNKRFLDIVVKGCLITALLFTIAMIVLFCIFQAVPDSLIVAFYGCLFGEFGCCSYIMKNKLKGKGDEDGQ